MAYKLNLNVKSINHASSPYLVLHSDAFILADVTAGAITINLPDPNESVPIPIGQVFSIKDELGLAATSNITIDVAGDAAEIDRSASYVMNTAFQCVDIIFDGSNYWIK